MKIFSKLRFPLGILSVFLLFRLLSFKQRLGFGHDEDLAGWIIKDIVVNHHFRLIGQETSIGKLFIGPLFYYLEALYFLIFRMDPLAGFFLVFSISCLTFFSLLFVLNRLFNERVSLIGSFLYASSFGLSEYEHWVVPTQPTLLWTVWYFYGLIKLSQGDRRSLPLLLILIGLIWHIHIAFVPLLALLPVAFFLGRKSEKKAPSLKLTIVSLVIFVGLISPLIVFEIKHNFIQTNGILQAALTDRHEVSGLQRVAKVWDGFSLSLLQPFYYTRVAQEKILLQFLAAAILVFCLIRTRKSLGKLFPLVIGWGLLVLLGQLLSKRAISEYYFSNMTILYLAIVALFLSRYRRLLIVFVSIVFLINLNLLFNNLKDNEGYIMRKEIVQRIQIEARNYPCIGINYITSPGKAAGFRYFFWLNNLKIVAPGNDVPTFSIVNPASYSSEVTFSRGNIGLILPGNFKLDPSVCNDPSRQLLNPLGYTD